MGHLLVTCGSCHKDRRESVFYEPPHDIRHLAPGSWRPPRLELHLHLGVSLVLPLIAARLPGGL
jgi:hypothetical protein